MAYEIYDTPAALKLIYNGTTRMLLKYHIREISVVKNNTIQIDLGENRRVFLPFSNIAIPAMNNAAALVEELNNYANSYQRYCFEQIQNSLALINTTGGNSGNNNGYNPFGYDPLFAGGAGRLIDERNPNVIYRGFSKFPNQTSNDAAWVIERITSQDGIITHQWADGDTTNFNHNWNDRETLNYI